MKIITMILVLLFGLVSLDLLANDTYVNGYYRSNGTYVQPHYRSAPDRNIYNNWSTQGNTNPYTGRQGTVSPYSQPSPSYNSNSLSVPSVNEQYNRMLRDIYNK